MRSETRQWVAGREADSLIKYGLIGKCLSSYCADLWYTYKVKEWKESPSRRETLDQTTLGDLTEQ